MSMHKAGRNDTITPGASCDNKYKTQAEVTLGDYLENRAHMYQKKMTFDEWWESTAPYEEKGNPYTPDSASFWAWQGWHASRENV